MRYLFVPSCEVAAQDKLVGTTTERRLIRALELWYSGNYDAIIVAGGMYLSPAVQTIPSGILMRIWLITNGVPSDRIVCEYRSRDTFENIAGALQLIHSDTNQRITVVTHWQHCLRFWITLSRGYRRKIQLVPMWYWIGLMGFLAEWAGLLVHVLNPKGDGLIASWHRKRRTYPQR